jgi:hypothetical protein
MPRPTFTEQDSFRPPIEYSLLHLFVFILLIGMRVNIKLLSLPAQLLCLLIRMKVAITISLFFLYSVLLFIVGNPSPRFFRPTIHSIPVDSSFINTTSFPFGLFRFFFFFLYVLKVLLFSHLPISLKMSSLCHLLIMVFLQFLLFFIFSFRRSWSVAMWKMQGLY